MHLTRLTPHIRGILPSTVIGLTVLSAVACSPDRVTTPAAPSAVASARGTAAGSLAPGAEQPVARFLALALQDADVRTQVRDAMRASVLDEHKLVLQKFIQSGSGKAMVQAAARKSGISVRSIEAQIAALPALDFYMPIRAHRQSWKGSENILVVATLDRKGPFVGYTTTGQGLSLAGKNRNQLDPLFMLHTAEPTGRRVNPQAAVPGTVIEEANDGQGSERVTLYPAGGGSVTVDLGDPNAQQQLAELSALLMAEGKISRGGDIVVIPQACTCEDCPELCEPPPQTYDTTRIAAFEVGFCDDHLCWTNSEIRVTAVFRTSAGVEIARAVYYHGDVNPHTYYVVNTPLIFHRILEGSGQYMQMNLVEEDGFGNNDDWCGDINVTSAMNGIFVYYPNSPDGCTDDPAYYSYSARFMYHWTPKY